MTGCAIAIALLAACGGPSYPPPTVQRTCTEPQTRESLDCKEFDFELRFSRDADLAHPAEQMLFHKGSRTECGCLHNLAAAVDAVAQEAIRSEVLEGCRCTRER
jgi:hypothetical protein